MNLNSLVIVADAMHARLFRTAQTSDPDVAVELVEVAALDAAVGVCEDVSSEFAKQIAARAAQFAHYHLS